MKTCIKCNSALPLTDQFFGCRQDSPDGFRNDCKACVKKRRASWHQQNRPDQLHKMNKYRAENLEVLINNKREYNKENRGTMIKKARDYYKKNHDRVLLQMKEHRIKNNSRINHDRRKRRKENIEVWTEARKKYIAKNRERIRKRQTQYCANRRKNDVRYRMLNNLRSRIRIALKKNCKGKKTMERS